MSRPWTLAVIAPLAVFGAWTCASGQSDPREPSGAPIPQISVQEARADLEPQREAPPAARPVDLVGVLTSAPVVISEQEVLAFFQEAEACR